MAGISDPSRNRTSAEGYHPDFMTAPPFAITDLTAHHAGDSYTAGAYAPARPQVSPTTPSYNEVVGVKRTLSQSTESGDDGVEGNEAKKKAPGMKRACNECRQQKVSLKLGDTITSSAG